MSKSKQHDRNRRAAREVGVPNFRWSGHSAQDLRQHRREQHEERRREGWRNELAWYLRRGYGESPIALWLAARIGDA